MSTATVSHVRDLADLAAHFSVSERTAGTWTRVEGFPPCEERGWNVAKIDDWLKQEGKGPYFQRGSSGGGDAREAKLKAETIGIELTNRQKAMDLQIRLGLILDAGEVAQLFERVAATQNSQLDQWVDIIAKEIPDKRPAAAQWKRHRTRMLKTAQRMVDGLRGQMQNLLDPKSEDD